jgi:hypothetical protein
VPPDLRAWENFYVIVGSSAAALTGLQFVVIALSADARAVQDEKAVRAFGSPTVVHFCAVLLLAAIVSAPGHTGTTIGICMSVVAAAGLAYALWVVRQARQQTGYQPVFEDWLYHAALPVFSYGCLLVAGVVAFQRPRPALYVVAATSLVLLYTGIHNAWDSAVYISTRRRPDSPEG